MPSKKKFRYDESFVQFGFIVIKQVEKRNHSVFYATSVGKLFIKALQIEEALGNASSQLSKQKRRLL